MWNVTSEINNFSVIMGVVSLVTEHCLNQG